MHSQQRSIYRGIVQSTALLGALRVVTIFLNFARDKALAVTLGPTGVGVFGLFDILVTTAVSTTSLGVNLSGIREIAAASAKGQSDREAAALGAVRRLTAILGIAGAVGFGILCVPIAHLTFGKSGFAIPVLILAVSVLFTSLTCGFRAQIQGLNQIPLLARVGAWTAITDTLIVIGGAALFGERGLAPALSLSAVVTAAIFWRATARSPVPPAKLAWPVLRQYARQLIGLGVSLALALFLTSYVNYGIRALVGRHLGLADAGFYIAAFALSGKPIGFLLDSMRADLYPRLSAAADDHPRLNALVNGQTEICLLLTIPGVLLMIGLAPYIIRVFYSRAFVRAAPLLAIFSLGIIARVIATPLGYVRVAKGRSALYFFTEIGLAAFHLGLAYILLRWKGLIGVVCAYASYASLQALFLTYIARHLTAFRWSRDCLRLFAILFPIILTIFVLSQAAPHWFCAAASVSAAAVLGCFNCRELVARLGTDHRISAILLRIPLFNRLALPGSHRVASLS